MEYIYIPLTSILFRKIKIFKKFSQIFRIFSEIRNGETSTEIYIGSCKNVMHADVAETDLSPVVQVITTDHNTRVYTERIENKNRRLERR